MSPRAEAHELLAELGDDVRDRGFVLTIAERIQVAHVHALLAVADALTHHSPPSRCAERHDTEEAEEGK